MASRSFGTILRLKNSPSVKTFVRNYINHYREVHPDVTYRKGIWKYFFWMPFRTTPDPAQYFSYRRALVLQPKIIATYAEVVATAFWTWIWFNMFTDFGHVAGDYPWKDPADYTDEELGIPKD